MVVLCVIMDFAARISMRIANLLNLRNGRNNHLVLPTKSCGSSTIANLDLCLADAYIRQQDRVREAMARARLRMASPKDAGLDDEWVGPWSRQQQRVRDAIAR